MASKINTPPVGLQDLLGSQSFGENPNLLTEVVSPTLEQFPFLSADKISAYTQQQNVAATDPAVIFAFLQPAGEVWMPLVWATTLDAATAVGIDWSVVYSLTNSGIAASNTVHLGPDAQGAKRSTFLVGEREIISHNFPQRFCVRGPCTWVTRLMYNDNGGPGNDSFTTTLMFTRLET